MSMTNIQRSGLMGKTPDCSDRPPAQTQGQAQSCQYGRAVKKSKAFTHRLPVKFPNETGSVYPKNISDTGRWSEAGFSLTQLLAAVVISSLTIAMATVAIFTFYTKYTELSLYSRLQQDAFFAIENMKYGYPVEFESQQYYFYGIANARSLTLPETGGVIGTSSAIRINPGVDEDYEIEGYRPYIEYYFDRYSYRIMARGLVGPRPPGRSVDTQLFPRAGDPNIEVLELIFSELPDNVEEDNIRIVGIELQARVITPNNRARYITYKTNVALGR